MSAWWQISEAVDSMCIPNVYLLHVSTLVDRFLPYEIEHVGYSIKHQTWLPRLTGQQFTFDKNVFWFPFGIVWTPSNKPTIKVKDGLGNMISLDKCGPFLNQTQRILSQIVPQKLGNLSRNAMMCCWFEQGCYPPHVHSDFQHLIDVLNHESLIYMYLYDCICI